MDNVGNERKNTIPPEPFVLTDKFILRKHKGKTPSLIVHLHQNYWRFDQQEGNFSYQTPEMRPFLEHLKKGTIPHDFLEELRREGVKFYDACLIVKVIDHKHHLISDLPGVKADDEKPFSIHNHNQFITPSPYAAHPFRDQTPAPKDERPSSSEKENVEPQLKKEPDSIPLKNLGTSQPKQFMKILKPTELSRSIDLMLDFVAPDPKARKQKVGQPSTPGGTVPATPTNERPPPLKKQKTRIDPKDHLEYEAKIVNATAPPLFLEPAKDLEHAEQIQEMLRDPLCNEPPNSPKSRKRTIAQLAADDAAAKEQERFMLIMDAKTSGTAGANAGAVDSQAVIAQFQPRFEKFNALDNIKRDLTERKQRENEKRLADDEVRRNHQQQQQEEENKRRMQRDAIEQRKQQAILRQQAQQHNMSQRQNQDGVTMPQQQQPGLQPGPRRNIPNQNQPSAIPPNMQNQMLAQASSPIIRQGTPLTMSSPAGSSRAMARNGSQTGGAGSPPRPGSALQHAHPNAAAMMRQASGQGGPSRNGTPQIPSGTPAMSNATPIMRQGTPAHSMTHASPVAMNAMAMGTPQMGQATMQGQMPNGMHPNAQAQMAALRRQQMQNQAMQSQMNGGNPQMAASMAQQQAQMERQAAIQQRQQAAMQGTPQPQHMSPNPQSQYNAQLRKQMMQQMGGQQGSPAPAQMSPQQIQQMQMMQMQQAQQQQQQQAAMQNQGGQNPQQAQNRGQINPQMQNMYQNLTMQYFKQAISIEAQKYGGNPGMIPTNVKHQLQQSAGRAAQQHLLKVRQAQQNQQMQNGMMGGQPVNQMMNNNMQMGGNMNNGMAAQQMQNHAAIMQQQQRMQNAQAQMQQANYSHQQQMMQQMNQQQHGPR